MFLSYNVDTVMVSPQFSYSVLYCRSLPQFFISCYNKTNIKHTLWCAVNFVQMENETFPTQPEVHCMSM